MFRSHRQPHSHVFVAEGSCRLQTEHLARHSQHLLFLLRHLRKPDCRFCLRVLLQVAADVSATASFRRLWLPIIALLFHPAIVVGESADRGGNLVRSLREVFQQVARLSDLFSRLHLD